MKQFSLATQVSYDIIAWALSLYIVSRGADLSWGRGTDLSWGTLILLSS